MVWLKKLGKFSVFVIVTMSIKMSVWKLRLFIRQTFYLINNPEY